MGERIWNSRVFKVLIGRQGFSDALNQSRIYRRLNSSKKPGKRKTRMNWLIQSWAFQFALRVIRVPITFVQNSSKAQFVLGLACGFFMLTFVLLLIGSLLFETQLLW